MLRRRCCQQFFFNDKLSWLSSAYIPSESCRDDKRYRNVGRHQYHYNRHLFYSVDWSILFYYFPLWLSDSFTACVCVSLHNLAFIVIIIPNTLLMCNKLNWIPFYFFYFIHFTSHIRVPCRWNNIWWHHVKLS